MKKKDLRQEREWQRRQEYKKSILEAAEAVIARKGYGATTMDDIAREAQFSKATLYRYFKSKGEVILAIIVNYVEELKQRLEEIRGMKMSAKEKLRESIRCVLQFHEEKENISQVFMMDESFMKKMHIFFTGPQKLSSEVDRKFINLIRTKRKEIFNGACQMLSEGVEAQEFRKMDIIGAVTILEAMLQGYYHGKIGLERKHDTNTETDLLYNFFFHGIEKKMIEKGDSK